MKKKLAYIFPGQGAQYVGMGKTFADAFPVAKRTFDEADDILGFSLSKLIFEGPHEKLTLTKNNQIAIYVVGVVVWRVLQEQLSMLTPIATAGLSLGEYTALTAAGKLDFEEGIKLVRARALYMHEAATKYPGTMVACLGIDPKVVKEMVTSLKDVWIANLNCPGQVVVSGTYEGIERASVVLKNRGAKRLVPLAVSGAFHSGLMAEAKEKLKNKIKMAILHSTTIDIVMNVPGDFVLEESMIRQNLIDQVVSPVHWEKSICAMKNREVELFVEVGCGKTLVGINRKIGVKVPTVSVERVEDLETLIKNLDTSC